MSVALASARVRLRRYEPADAVACHAVLVDASTVEDGMNEAARALATGWHTVDAMAAEFEPHFSLVAEVGGEIRGVGCLKDGLIKRLYVTPSFHRLGIGRAIVTALEEEARRGGVEVLRVDSAPVSVAFYERLGFRRIRPDAWIRGDAVFEYVVMDKPLAVTSSPAGS